MNVSVPREFIPNHLNIDLLAHVVPNGTHKILIDPGL